MNLKIKYGNKVLDCTATKNPIYVLDTDTRIGYWSPLTLDHCNPVLEYDKPEEIQVTVNNDEMNYKISEITSYELHNNSIQIKFGKALMYY